MVICIFCLNLLTSYCLFSKSPCLIIYIILGDKKLFRIKPVNIYKNKTGFAFILLIVNKCLCFSYVFGGALLFKEYEGWDYLDGSYFCFISLSTIGFGDIVPGEKSYYNTEQELKMGFIFCSMYLMLGMALIAMCFNLMQVRLFLFIYLIY